MFYSQILGLLGFPGKWCLQFLEYRWKTIARFPHKLARHVSSRFCRALVSTCIYQCPPVQEDPQHQPKAARVANKRCTHTMPAACAGRINIVQCQGQWRFDVSFHVFPLFLNVSFANSECDGDQFRSSPSSPFPSHVIRHAPKSRLGTKPHPADPAASNSLAHPTVGTARRPGSELNTWLVSILSSANDNSLRIKA